MKTKCFEKKATPFAKYYVLNTDGVRKPGSTAQLFTKLQAQGVHRVRRKEVSAAIPPGHPARDARRGDKCLKWLRNT